MSQSSDLDTGVHRRVIVEAESVDGARELLDLETPDRRPIHAHPDEYEELLEAVRAVQRGLREATEEDPRGKQRKVIQEYAGMEHVDDETFSGLLDAMAAFGLADRSGERRWRTPDGE